MNVPLDENFPLGLVRVLEADGLRVDHIITLGWRGASDSRIRQRLVDRIQVWRSAVKQLADAAHDIRLFELADDGTLVPWSADRHDR